MFFEHLAGCLARGEVYSEKDLPQNYGREAFRANAFYDKLADWEIQWVNSRHFLPESATGDSVQTSARLLEKYSPLLTEVYANGPAQPEAKPVGETHENLGELEK